MRKRRKDALKLLAIATPMLAYGALTFEIGGTASAAEAIAKSTVTTLGLAGTVAGLLMFFTKNSLGLINPKEPTYSLEEDPSDSWRIETVWEEERRIALLETESLSKWKNKDKVEVVEEEEPKLKMPS